MIKRPISPRQMARLLRKRGMPPYRFGEYHQWAEAAIPIYESILRELGAKEAYVEEEHPNDHWIDGIGVRCGNRYYESVPELFDVDYHASRPWAPWHLSRIRGLAAFFNALPRDCFQRVRRQAPLLGRPPRVQRLPRR